MGDELSRLASFEAECHRKDGVIAALRDEVGDFKAAALQASNNSLRYISICIYIYIYIRPLMKAEAKMRRV